MRTSVTEEELAMRRATCMLSVVLAGVIAVGTIGI
jgi:hypothetical protein